jgi:hypothetical protein
MCFQYPKSFHSICSSSSPLLNYIFHPITLSLLLTSYNQLLQKSFLSYVEFYHTVRVVFWIMQSGSWLLVSYKSIKITSCLETLSSAFSLSHFSIFMYSFLLLQDVPIYLLHSFSHVSFCFSLPYSNSIPLLFMFIFLHFISFL